MSVTNEPTNKNGDGDCFQTAMGFVAAGMVEEHAKYAGRPLVKNEKSPWRIVHGIPWSVAHGRRIWHAWVEYISPLGPTTVLDYSNEKKLQMSRETYYRVGKLDETTVWRYTPAEAEKIYRKRKHCGPWPAEWKTLAL